MRNTSATSVTATTKTSGRKSQKGVWGHVGAPPKVTKWPVTQFTMAQLFDRNSDGTNAQCHLSLRNKVATGLDAGTILQLKPKKQSNGGVGRPKAMYILKENFDSSRHTLLSEPEATPASKKKAVKKQKKTPTVSVVETVSPAAAPMAEVVAPVEPVVVIPVPVTEPDVATVALAA